MPADQSIWRVLLFMPGDDLHKIKKGAGLSVDAVIMDLEDAVALNHKQAARETVAAVLADPAIDFGHTERLVRVNSASTGWQADDIISTMEGHPDGVVIPKVQTALDVQQVSQDILDAEHRYNIDPGSTYLLAIVETALGVVNLREIASASERLTALMFGAEDLAGSMGAVRTPDGHEGSYARSAVVLHAAAFDLQAIDTPHVDLEDEDDLRAQARIAMQMGYTGKMAIHPKQIAPIIEVFTPTTEEAERARRLIAAHEAHQQSGTGVFAFEGRMVDQPMIRAAERVLARARHAD